MLKKIVHDLEKRRTALQGEIKAIGEAIAALSTHRVKKQGKRHLSAAARARISRAQKKRWAAERKK
jgi:hypothetical protein